MNKKTAVVIFILSFFLTGCIESPERGAKEWFDAVLNMDGNKIFERTCDAQKAAMQEAGMWNTAMALIPQMMGLSVDIQGDVSDLKFTTSEKTETYAYVHVNGEMRVAILALVQSYPIDETWLMVNEDGKWRWCGAP